MTVHVSLGDLSFESNEVLAVDVDPSESFAGVPSDIAESAGIDQADRLLDVYSAIINRGCVCRADMDQIKDLTETFPSLAKLFKRYPINSFSVEPSNINYEVSTEGFARTAYDAVVNALRDVLRFLVNNLSRLWKFLTQNAQRTAAVDDVQNKLADIQRFILEVDKIMSDTPVAADYAKARKAVMESERHNVSKSWNEFRNFVVTRPADSFELIDMLSGVLKVSVPAFGEAVETLLTDLTNSATEQDVMAAVAKMELFQTPNGKLAALSSKYGYRPGQIRIADNMTPFHANASFIKSIFRSWSNHRMDISPEAFSQAVVSQTVMNWGEVVTDAVRSSSQRTERLLSKINSFNENSLKPGMDQIYSTVLVPFFKALLSIIQGYTLMEGCLGELVANRDNAVISISKASLNVAKDLDKFVRKNGDHLTIGGKTVLASRRRAVIAAMS
jgi:hypothetical protein